MASLYEFPFQPIDSTAPGFNTTLASTGKSYALESSGAREWQFPSSRTIRLCNLKGDDYHFLLGTSDVAVDTSTATGMAVLGGVAEVFTVRPGQTHIVIAGSSTDVAVNITLGTGY